MEVAGDRGPAPSQDEAKRLALSGKWKEIIARVEPLATSGLDEESGAKSPVLTLLAYYFLALFRMREYAKIGEQIEKYGVLVKGVDSPDGSFEEPKVPFVFLWVYAEYPIHNGDVAKGLDRLYCLLHTSKILKRGYDDKLQFDVGSAGVDPVSDAEVPPTGGVSTASLRHAWDRRVKMILCVIACHHCTLKQYAPAVKLLSGLANETSDPHFLSLLAYVLLQLGDVASARKVCDGLRAAVSAGAGAEEARFLVANLEGLLHFASDKFEEAIERFDFASKALPSCPVACTNLAVGHMYARNLHVSIKVLETRLAENHALTLEKPMVLNLCSMYELASTKCKESKQTLHTWILKNTADDFDRDTTRLVA